MGGPFAQEDIVEEMAGRRERELITAASAAYLNQGMELTGNSVRSCLAPAIPSSSCLAFGRRTETNHNPPDAQLLGGLRWNDRDALVCDMDTYPLANVKASLLQPVST